MQDSKIEWTDHTFNPWIGCSKVSPGCHHCYAETLMDGRFGRGLWGPGRPRERTGEKNWNLPRRWNQQAQALGRRYRVFCASLADWLDYEVPNEWRADLCNLIAETPHLDWLLLTKRPQNWKPLMMNCEFLSTLAREWVRDGSAPANVWFGVSAEDQIRWRERVGAMMRIPAFYRFVSAEPLLGPIDMGALPQLPDWLIVGGESGGGARVMDPGWVRSLRDQCQKLKCAFLFKQWGGVDKKLTGRELDGRTWEEFPDVAK